MIVFRNKCLLCLIKCRHPECPEQIDWLRDVISWSSSLRSEISSPAAARSAAAAHAQRAKIDARDDGSKDALARGQSLLDKEHPSSAEIEERCRTVVDELGRLANAWAERQVALDQLIDWRCFLRDAKQLNALCAAQEAALATGTLLLQQNHVESERIQEELAAVNDRRKKLDVVVGVRRGALLRARPRAQFTRDTAEARSWVADKMAQLQLITGEVTDLEQLEREWTTLEDAVEQRGHDVKVDDNHVKSVQALADKLMQQGPTQHAVSVAARRDGVLLKWRALTGALQRYRERLAAALQLHSFNRDVQETSERLSCKAALFRSEECGRDLSAAHELKRRLEAAVREAGAIRDWIQQLKNDGAALARRCIKVGAAATAGGHARSDMLVDAIKEHKFEENLKETEKRLDRAEPDSVTDAQAQLEHLHETKIIPPDLLPSIFENALESDVLSSVLRTVHNNMDRFPHSVVAYLKNICRVKRFSALAMFLSAIDKECK
ncbi:unnamed protein product [Danaus chrysippus]|uniref:(African queen) hypothetical protein n=1 Tax=Danaus chrysippus TaxID=151541 RepID=A0A8J2VTD4_9NEOP|nr:unnamed protein product [Danaus chrysippus]